MSTAHAGQTCRANTVNNKTLFVPRLRYRVCLFYHEDFRNCKLKDGCNTAKHNPHKSYIQHQFFTVSTMVDLQLEPVIHTYNRWTVLNFSTKKIMFTSQVHSSHLLFFTISTTNSTHRLVWRKTHMCKESHITDRAHKICALAPKLIVE